MLDDAHQADLWNTGLACTCGFQATHSVLPVYDMEGKYIKEWTQNLQLIPLFLLGFLIFTQILQKKKQNWHHDKESLWKISISGLLNNTLIHN